VILGHYDNHFLPDDRDEAYRHFAGIPGAENDVIFAALEPGDILGSDSLKEMEDDVFVFIHLHEGFDNTGYKTGGERRDIGDGDFASAEGNLMHFALCRRDIIQDFFGVFQKDLAGLSQDYISADALEKHYAQFIFERENSPREGGLGNSQVLRSMIEMLCFRGLIKVLKLVKGHKTLPPLAPVSL
jgi:hypothetical protein